MSYDYLNLEEYGARNPEHFLYPFPSRWDRFKSFVVGSIQAAPEYVKGIDISKWQGAQIDFGQVKAAGYEFVIIKATDGLAVDPLYQVNWPKIVDAGLIPGAYHFFRGNVNGNSQAVHHMSVIDELLESTNLVIPSHADVESTDGVTVATRMARLWDFMAQITISWRAPGIYSSSYYWNRLAGNARLKDPYTGWVAHWTGLQKPAIPAGWPEASVKIWQWGISGKFSWCPASVPGVPGAVDLDRYLGSLDDLKEFAGYDGPPDCPCQDQIDELERRIKVLENRVF